METPVYSGLHAYQYFVSMRVHSFVDHCVALFDTALQTVCPTPMRQSTRANPSTGIKENPLNSAQKQHAAGLMRVNHAGEISAQALYQGQALTAQKPHIRDHLQAAAAEEIDHLAWCEQRLTELDAEPSVFAPFWYSASFVIGALAGLAGDRISLGFLAETEEQVTRHLHHHLQKLPTDDHKSRAIIQQMAIDENNHALSAYAHGAMTLPPMIRTLMRWSSKLLTTSSYYL